MISWKVITNGLRWRCGLAGLVSKPDVDAAASILSLLIRTSLNGVQTTAVNNHWVTDNA